MLYFPTVFIIFVGDDEKTIRAFRESYEKEKVDIYDSVSSVISNSGHKHEWVYYQNLTVENPREIVNEIEEYVKNFKGVKMFYCIDTGDETIWESNDVNHEEFVVFYKFECFYKNKFYSEMFGKEEALVEYVNKIFDTHIEKYEEIEETIKDKCRYKVRRCEMK